MAVQRDNIVMHGTSGSFSRLITFKQYNGKTVVAHYPDMSKVVYTKAQIAERFRFKLAVAYARSVIADPVKKKAYSGKKHFSAYHAAIAEYINTSKAEENAKSNTPVENKLSSAPIKIHSTITTPGLAIVSGIHALSFTDQPPS